MGRSKAAKKREQKNSTQWKVLTLNGEDSAAAGMSVFWAKDAAGAAKKVFRQSKAASKITIAPCDAEHQKYEFDVTAFSFTQERKRSEFRRRSGLSKLDQAMELLELA